MTKIGVMIVIFGIFLIMFSYALQNENVIQVTNNHPFLVNGTWIAASELEIGDYLTNIDGKKVRIINIKDIQDTQEVFNFETPLHNYIVSPFDIVVHNSKQVSVPVPVPVQPVLYYQAKKSEDLKKAAELVKTFYARDYDAKVAESVNPLLQDKALKQIGEKNYVKIINTEGEALTMIYADCTGKVKGTVSIFKSQVEYDHDGIAIPGISQLAEEKYGGEWWELGRLATVGLKNFETIDFFIALLLFASEKNIVVATNDEHAERYSRFLGEYYEPINEELGIEKLQPYSYQEAGGSELVPLEYNVAKIKESRKAAENIAHKFRRNKMLSYFPKTR